MFGFCTKYNNPKNEERKLQNLSPVDEVKITITDVSSDECPPADHPNSSNPLTASPYAYGVPYLRSPSPYVGDHSIATESRMPTQANQNNVYCQGDIGYYKKTSQVYSPGTNDNFTQPSNGVNDHGEGSSLIRNHDVDTQPFVVVCTPSGSVEDDTIKNDNELQDECKLPPQFTKEKGDITEMKDLPKTENTNLKLNPSDINLNINDNVEHCDVNKTTNGNNSSPNKELLQQCDMKKRENRKRIISKMYKDELYELGADLVNYEEMRTCFIGTPTNVHYDHSKAMIEANNYRNMIKESSKNIQQDDPQLAKLDNEDGTTSESSYNTADAISRYCSTDTCDKFGYGNYYYDNNDPAYEYYAQCEDDGYAEEVPPCFKEADTCHDINCYQHGGWVEHEEDYPEYDYDYYDYYEGYDEDAGYDQDVGYDGSDEGSYSEVDYEREGDTSGDDSNESNSDSEEDSSYSDSDYSEDSSETESSSSSMSSSDEESSEDESEDESESEEISQRISRRDKPTIARKQCNESFARNSDFDLAERGLMGTSHRSFSKNTEKENLHEQLENKNNTTFNNIFESVINIFSI